MIALLRRHPALAAAAVLLFAIGAAAIVWERPATDSGAQARASRPPLPVVVAEARLDEFVDRIEAVGTARSNESVEITARVTDTVRELHFEDGMEVEAGAILAELTGDEESAQLDEARSEFRDAQRNFERVSRLYAQKTVSGSQLDAATAARDSARARVEAIEARLADRLIRAPFAGVLGLRSVSPGTLVQPGDEITTLDDVSVIKLDFAVPETFLASLRPGLGVVARSAAYPDLEFRGPVETVGSRVDPVTRAVTVRALLPNPERRLRPGMLLSVDLIRTRRDALMIPEDAIVPVQDRHYVFVLAKGDAIERREVTPGRRRPGDVEIVAGLEAGERVVVEGTTRVREGSRVEVQRVR